MGNAKRIGIFGGSFDPVHLGHIKLALSAKKEYKLDTVIFVPARKPPHKQDKKLLPGKTRLKMLSLALKGLRSVRIDAYELKRPGASYTYRTLEHYSRKFRGAELFFIAGGDSLSDMKHWKRPERILQLAEPITGRRRGARKLPGARYLKASMPRVSSSEVRSRLRRGLSAAGLVPREVEKYIKANGLYSG